MRTLIYSGPADAIEIKALDNLVVRRGEPFEAPAEIADLLLAQTTFSEPNIKVGK